MELGIVLAIASGLIIIVLCTLLFWQRESGEDGDNSTEGRKVGGGRANARARLRAAAQQVDDEDENADQEKIGSKKRAKLEAKAEKKAQREIEEREREDRKRRKELAEEERKKAEEKEEEEEAKRLEEERKAKEEKERQEHEEYLKLKAAFSIEEEGYDETDEDPEALLSQFITYIKDNKVVVLEELARHFRLKTQAVISRIQELQANGSLTGVIDDRGKFIYISQSELEAVAKFVKQRGRVSISELAESSQKLINLTPNLPA